MSTLKRRIGFIGAGKMGAALIKGILKTGLTESANIIASDPIAEVRGKVREETGIRVTEVNEEVVKTSDVVVLAVYPQVLLTLLPQLAPKVTDHHLVVSIAAGITTRQLLDGLMTPRRVVRAMPNTPALVGAGATGYCLAGTATEEDSHFVAEFLGVVGHAWRVEERVMDAVTGLSGSGPAYVFTIIEALSDGGVRMGLPRPVATALAAHTVYGAAKMVLETGLHTGQLKDQVTSPGGTTIAGLHALERAGIRPALMNAVEAASLRSQELARHN